MIPTDKLETIIIKCEIIKEFMPLPPSVLGYYYSDGDYSLILIAEKIRNNERLYRIVLAEEVGHYRTTIGDITPRRYMCYSDRINVDKKELLALKWATNFLIPTNMLISVIKQRIATTFHDLVNYFFVTEEFLIEKFKFMAKEKSTWAIDEKRMLYLGSLPSIFIYNKTTD
ncbi:peptidase [Crassaminicella profunda]|uniref:peptidase n=1 Tax=Crassaminicella profunda TaxID=1286698 RepID=UPI001CA7A687|nr:peptidase [Crassaminicella profunda]QZY56662.1 peptidase [Crassaminicella profunda]